MVEITTNAVQKFKDILKEHKADNYGIRIFTAGGG